MPIFGILVSAIWTMLSFLLRSVVMKLVTLFVLYFIVQALIGAMQRAGLFPTAASLNGAWSGIPSDIWYFLNLFGVSTGFPLVLSAYVTRFIIRRIPVVG